MSWKKDVDEITETVNTVDDDIKNSLEAIDPWMAQKMDRQMGEKEYINNIYEV